MKFSKKERRVRNGYFAAFGLLLISYVLVILTFLEMEHRVNLVNRTNEIIMNLELLVSNMKDAETAVRGYVIMKDKAFLGPYNHSEQKSDSLLTILKKYEDANQVQSKRIDTIAILIKEKFSIIKSAIHHVNIGTFDLDLLPENGYRGFYVMNDIRQMVSNMQHAENNIHLKRTQTLSFTVGVFKFIIITTLIISILLAAYSFITFNKENKAKRLYRQQLEEGIENLKQMNKELVELKSVEKFLVSGRISRTIAHEVRNPLTNISLAAEQLIDAIPKTEDTELLLAMIIRNSNRINELVSELLNSTKFSQLELENISIHTILDKAIELAYDRIELYGIRIIKKYSHNPCLVNVDPKLMNIAFLNILVNAIEATEPDKGHIEIKTENRQNKSIISIRDNGKGMDIDALSRIFEPYFTSKPNGNGLGLTNTQNIILNHKGNIQVESKPGEGSVFIITLYSDELHYGDYQIDRNEKMEMAGSGK